MENHLVEIFSSIQGEGLYLGTRQIFLRFAGCNLVCSYCDTDFASSAEYRVELIPGSGVFTHYKNPTDATEVFEILNKLSLKGIHSISFTGGEPLLHVEFLKTLITLLKKTNIKSYLETNGTLPRELATIIELIDIICMDIKLPSSYGGQELWDVHEKFIKVGAQKQIFIKTVVTADTLPPEIIKTCQIIVQTDRKIPLIIQPVDTHPGFSGKSPSIKKLFELQELALKYLEDVRVIPQTHKYLGIL